MKELVISRKKLEDIYEAVCNEIPYPVIAFRSAYAISIVSQFPYRHIQIILRLYSSPAEILMGFDVDACSIGFDGSQVYMTPRCHQALVRQMNTVDMTVVVLHMRCVLPSMLIVDSRWRFPP